MNQKHVTLAACLLAFGLAAQAQNGGISPDMLKKFRVVIRIRLPTRHCGMLWEVPVLRNWH